jgi:hypothetical protein
MSASPTHAPDPAPQHTVPRRYIVLFGVVFGLMNWFFLGAVAVFEGRSFLDRSAVLLPASLAAGLLLSEFLWRRRAYVGRRNERSTPPAPSDAP